MFNRLSAIMFALFVSCAAYGQGTKPAPGPAVQMPGDNGKVGVPYSMGAKGDEFVFTLEKAEFAARSFSSDNAMFAEEGQRLLIISFAVQNPGKADRYFHHQAFQFTVVSPDDKNYAYHGYVYHPERLEGLQVQIKPAQKIRAFFAIAIHPKGVVNKLIVQRGTGTPVLRYDLRDRVKPITGPFASDNGVDMLEIGKAKVGVPFGVGYFDYNVEKVEESSAESSGFTPESGNKLVIATITVKNVSKIKPAFGQGFLVPKLLDGDGEEIRLSAMAKTSSADPPTHQNLDPDQQVRFRFVFDAPAKAKAAVLQLKDAHSARSVKLDLSAK